MVGGVNYCRPIDGTGMSWFVNASVRWEDDRRTGTQAIVPGTDMLAEVDIQESNAKANLRLGLEQTSGLWSVELWSNSLFDEQTRSVTANAPLRGIASLGTAARSAFLEAPRTYGLTLRTRM